MVGRFSAAENLDQFEPHRFFHQIPVLWLISNICEAHSTDFIEVSGHKSLTLWSILIHSSQRSRGVDSVHKRVQFRCMWFRKPYFMIATLSRWKRIPPCCFLLFWWHYNTPHHTTPHPHPLNAELWTVLKWKTIYSNETQQEIYANLLTAEIMWLTVLFVFVVGWFTCLFTWKAL